jgi:hypothetical protein
MRSYGYKIKEPKRSTELCIDRMARRGPKKRKANVSLNSIAAPSKKRGGNTRAESSISFLDALPDELLLEILDRVGIYIRTWPYAGYIAENVIAQTVSTYYYISLTSRRLNRLVLPYLYAVIDYRCGHANLLKLLRTVNNTPCLAEKIKSVCLYDDQSTTFVRPSSERYLIPHIERRELCRKIDDFCRPYNLHPKSVYLNPDFPTNYVATLIAILPKISRLDIWDGNELWYPSDFYPRHDNPIWLKLLYAAALGPRHGLPPRFEQLHHIRIRMGPLPLERILPLLALPSLRTLQLVHVVQVEDIEPHGQWGTYGTRESPVENLELIDSSIDSKPTATLISCIRGLRSFTLIYDVSRIKYFPMLDYPTNVSALHEHKHSLERIIITNVPGPSLWRLEICESGWYGSLRELELVKFMEVDLSAFTSDIDGESKRESLSENLPPRLEKLVISADERNTKQMAVKDTWVTDIERLAMSYRGELPELRSVRVFEYTWGPRDNRGPYKPPYVGIRRSDEERVIDFCAEQGLALSIQKCASDHWVERGDYV